MSRIDNSLLQVVQREGPLDFNRAACCIAEVARQLAELHRAGKLHRDVRPGNVTFDSSGSATLRDSQFASIDDAGLIADLTGLDADAILESVGYLAPEQALNSCKVDARSDIYSLGCVLYFALVGQPPFSDGSISERLLQHQIADPPAIKSLRPTVPQTLISVCETMLAKKPNERYQSAGEVVQVLENS